MMTPAQAQIEGRRQQEYYESPLRTKSFNDVAHSKMAPGDECRRILCHSAPTISELATDVIKRARRINRMRIQTNSICLGSSKIAADDRIKEIKKKYDEYTFEVNNDDGLRRYERMRKIESYDFCTLRASSKVHISVSDREFSILSEMSKMIGIPSYSLFQIAFLIGIQDAGELAEYIKNNINKEVIHFWQHVDRRHRRFVDNDF